MKRAAVASAVLVLLASGCSLRGLNDYVLPGAKGGGADGYRIRVELASAANLVPNAEVKVGDVSVGTVRRIRLDGWHAIAEVSLPRSVRLSTGTQARVAQKSLLGAEYLELVGPVPAGGGPLLADGDTIPLAATGRYPETEEVLAAISTLLNGGGLANLEVIVRELNSALDGNTANARVLVRDLDSVLGQVRRQQDELVGLVDALDRLSGRLAAQRDRLGSSLVSVARGIDALAAQRVRLTDALAALGRLSTVGSQVVTRDGAALTADVHQLTRVLDRVEEAGAALPESLDLIATVLFPISGVPYVTKGDYLNFAATFDLSVPALTRGLVPDLAGAGAMAALLDLLGLGPAFPVAGKPTSPTPPAVPVKPEPAKPNRPGPLGPVLDPLAGLLDDLLGRP